MTAKELRVVYSAIWHAKETIEELCCADYPYTEFEDKELRDMFYTLNRMCITLNGKMAALSKYEKECR